MFTWEISPHLIYGCENLNIPDGITLKENEDSLIIINEERVIAIFDKYSPAEEIKKVLLACGCRES